MYKKYLLLTLAFLGYAISKSTYDDNNSFWDLGSVRPDDKRSELRLWLTINAQKRFIEVSWVNAPARDEDRIMLTSQEPVSFKKLAYIPEAAKLSIENEGSGFGCCGGGGGSAEKSTENITTTESPYKAKDINYWISNDGKNPIVAALKPAESSLWFTTGVPFDYNLSKSVNVQTSGYGYWASYVAPDGSILASTSLRAYPRWMNDMRSIVGNLRFRDLFIPGSHDSGSYRNNFDPLLKETLITKYSLCQDDDIRGQLMHGIRYLDIRVG